MKFNKKAQQIIEYLLLVVAVVAGVLSISKPQGVMHIAVEKSLNRAVDTIYQSYTWRTGRATSACSKTCGIGTQTRSVWCEKDDGSTVADAFCAAVSLPPSGTVDCDAGSCGAKWFAEPFGNCNAACGDGSHTRVVQCRDSNGGVVSPGLCTGKKPALVEGCNLGDCFVWNVVEGLCDATCGIGSKPRTVTCQNRLTGDTVALSSCDAGTKPSDTIPCDTSSSCGYQWQQSGFGNCGAPCGPSTKTQTVTCVRTNDNKTVPESNCDTSKRPLDTAPCNLPPCTHWELGAWGACNVNCGSGTQTTSVTCHDFQGILVADNLCDISTKLSDTRDCPSQPICTYSWGNGDWSDCNVPCGAGTQTRSVFCTRTNDNTSADVLECRRADPKGEPKASQDCTGDCYRWVKISESGCSNKCGFGKNTIKNECKSTAGATVPPQKCINAGLGDLGTEVQNCTGTTTCCGNRQCDNFGGYVESCGICAQDCPGCCGNGTCDAIVGENCNSCPQDCGVLQANGTRAGCCGNGFCENGVGGRPAYGESCGSCGADCNNNSCSPDLWVSGACGQGKCVPTEMYQTRSCFCGPETRCAKGVPACIFHCTGGPPSTQSSTMCPGDDKGLKQSLPWKYVSACSPARKCQAKCNGPVYILSGISCINHCGNGICEDGSKGRPNYGETIANSCGDCHPPPKECCLIYEPGSETGCNGAAISKEILNSSSECEKYCAKVDNVGCCLYHQNSKQCIAWTGTIIKGWCGECYSWVCRPKTPGGCPN